MPTDAIQWHTLSKNTDNPEDTLCAVNFTMSRSTAAAIEFLSDGPDHTIGRLKQAIAERGYEYVNIDWIRKVLYVKKL